MILLLRSSHVHLWVWFKLVMYYPSEDWPMKIDTEHCSHHATLGRIARQR